MSEFYIEFDLLSGHNPGTGATLGQGQLSPYGWRSIGHPDGGRFINRTGKTIRAIHIQTNNTANTFYVDKSSLGRLFDSVWVKDDGSEAIFKQANIPNVIGVFWMRVPPNTAQEIQDCDTGQGCPFIGQAMENDPPDPTESGWTEIRSVDAPIDERWAGLRHSTSSDLRIFDVFAEHGDQILYLAQGQIYLYDHKTGESHQLSDPAKTLPKSDRLTFDGTEYNLWIGNQLCATGIVNH